MPDADGARSCPRRLACVAGNTVLDGPQRWRTGRFSHSCKRISPSRALSAGISERSPSPAPKYRVWVDNNCAGVVARAEELTDQIVETETRNLAGAVELAFRPTCTSSVPPPSVSESTNAAVFFFAVPQMGRRCCEPAMGCLPLTGWGDPCDCLRPGRVNRRSNLEATEKAFKPRALQLRRDEISTSRHSGHVPT